MTTAAALLVGAAWGLWIWARPGQDAVWRQIQERGVWLVATDASYPPFSATDANGALFGFDIDLAEAIGRRWGVRVEFESIAYDALLSAVAAGRDEAVISAFVAQPARAREVAYTRSYFVGGTVLLMPAAALAIPGPDPLQWAAGRTLAVEYGAAGDVLARRWARQAPGVTVLPRATAEEAAQAAADGAASAAVVDALSAYAFLAQHAGLALAGPPLEPEAYVIAVSARSPDLLRELNAALDALEADGTLAELRVKWLGAAAQ